MAVNGEDGDRWSLPERCDPALTHACEKMHLELVASGLCLEENLCILGLQKLWMSASYGGPSWPSALVRL